MRAGTLIGLVLLAVLAPSTAGAATLSRDGQDLVFTDAPGAHVVRIELFLGQVRFRSGQAISPAANCSTFESPGSASCNAPFGSLVLDLGDGDDELWIDEGAVDPFTLRLQVFGGPGDDQLTAGRADDLLEGGDGDDTLAGGPGTDMASWDDADSPVVATVPAAGASTPVNGRAGEQDGLAEIEGLRGGSAADALTGSAGDDILDGGDGDDELLGLAGEDELVGGPGEDVLDGGSDGDYLDTAEDPVQGDAAIACGPGDDDLFADNGADPLPDDCEVIAPDLDGVPQLAGTAVEGELLTRSLPGASGRPIAFTTAWLRCAPGGACEDTGEADADHRVVAQDVGSTVRALVTVENRAGSVEAVSGESAVVRGRPEVPAAAPVPTVAAPALRPATVGVRGARCARRRCHVTLAVGGDVAALAVQLRRGSRRIAAAHPVARSGTVRVVLRSRRALPRGRYAVRATVRGRDGRTASARRTLRLR